MLPLPFRQRLTPLPAALHQNRASTQTELEEAAATILQVRHRPVAVLRRRFHLPATVLSTRRFRDGGVERSSAASGLGSSISPSR